MSFDLDQLTADCGAALAESTPSRVVRDLLAEVVADTAAVTATVGEPERGGIQKLHVSDELTILNVIWAPKMTLMPHNHNMWAVIGVYGGREDNIFWRRCKDDPKGRIEAAGAKSLGPQDVRPLGPEIIHSVTNPTGKLTGAIHIYGGDFFAMHRSEWDPEALEEHPYDVDKNLGLFEEANRLL
jgi:predicted metal-dependent enzyme (double-stranded beta helix superfamily)